MLFCYYENTKHSVIIAVIFDGTKLWLLMSPFRETVRWLTTALSEWGRKGPPTQSVCGSHAECLLLASFHLVFLHFVFLTSEFFFLNI